MEKTYTAIPASGAYRILYIFSAPSPNGTIDIQKDLADFAVFTTAMAMHNGVWEMGNYYGFEIRLYDEEQVVYRRLMIVDSAFTPSTMRLIPLELEGEGDDEKPVGATNFVTPANLVTIYGNHRYLEKIEDWERDNYSSEEIVRALEVEMFSGDSPWRGDIFVRNVSVFQDGETAEDDVFLGLQWTFLDGGIRYLTAVGVLTEVEFQKTAVTYTGRPQPDPDFEGYMLRSVSEH